jgi:hypothetical protein
MRIVIFILLVFSATATWGVSLSDAKREYLPENRGRVLIGYSLEDQNSFKRLPNKYLDAIMTALAHDKNTSEFYHSGLKEDGCGKHVFVGRRIPANSSKETRMWLITATGCILGAHTAPAFILEEQGKEIRMLLLSAGQNVYLRQATRHGYHDIEITDGAAGYFTGTIYSYNGKSYVETDNIWVDFSGPEEASHYHENFEKVYDW